MNRTHVSRFGIEFFLIIALPVAVIIAGAATLSLAVGSGFTPVPETTGIVVNPR